MKENIDVCYVFNLVDSNGTKLQLRLGRLKERQNHVLDRGFRWSFVGTKIPMPIRAYTWFNGFPENIMLDWLKGNGWALRSRVEMCTGKATVYELPEHSKGNNIPELEQAASAQAMYNSTIPTELERVMKKISEAKDGGRTSCYIASSTGKIPVEVIEALLHAGYDITYEVFNKGYGDWFVQAFWDRPCKQGKIFHRGVCSDPVEMSIQDYKNA